MNIIWIIGFLFAMGILMEDDDGKDKWYITIFCVVLALLGWPVYLGHLCEKFLIEKNDRKLLNERIKKCIVQK